MKRIQYILATVLFAALTVISGLQLRAQAASSNLVANPSAETAVSGQPADWQADSWGSGQATLTYQSGGHTGSKSLYAAVTAAGDGDAKWMMNAVPINPNTTYSYSDFYMSNTSTKIDLAYNDPTGVTSYAYLQTLPASSGWKQASGSFTTPANATSVSVWHVIDQVGWLQTDDYSLTGPAVTTPPTSGVVSASPATFTPQIPLGENDATYAYAQVGSTMYAGGSFASLNGTARSNVGAFSATNGTLASFAPKVNGAVWALVPLGNNQIALGGEFTTVNGVARRGLAVVDGTTGALVSGFNANLNGDVYDAKLVGGRLIIGGTFTKKLQAVSPTTGTDTGYLNLNISGTRIHRFAVNPQGTELVAIGKFASVSGQTRRQAFMVNLGSTSGSLSSWYYQPLLKYCSVAADSAYLRGVAFSPDGSYFVVDGTGYTSAEGDLGSTICDAAARFETGVLAPSKPTWINYTGGDSFYSVAISSTAVYVGGHNRWLDNPYGSDTCGSSSCVSRPGIGAIDPATGQALSWNPERTRGVGAQVLYLTPAGLWVGSDTRYGGVLGCANPGGPNKDDCSGQKLEQHAGIGFLPY